MLRRRCAGTGKPLGGPLRSAQVADVTCSDWVSIPALPQYMLQVPVTRTYFDTAPDALTTASSSLSRSSGYSPSELLVRNSRW